MEKRIPPCVLLISLLSGCIDLKVGMLPANAAPVCSSCDEEAGRAAYLEQIRRSGFLATRDSALLTPGQVRSTELK